MNIQDYLNQLSAATVYYRPNPGNAGDALIAAATYQLFKTSGINCVTLVPRRGALTDRDLTNRIVVYGGGGNLTPDYRDAATFLEQAHRLARKLIVLPHTVAGHAGLIRELGRNVDLICRERVSFDYLGSLAPQCNVLLMDDLALSLDVRELLSMDSPLQLSNWGRPALRHSVRCLRRVARFRLKQVFGQRVGPRLARRERALNCFRMDDEKTLRPLPADNFDISHAFGPGDWLDEPAVRRSARRLLRFIANADILNTNRLHVCLAGILMGKRVNLYANSTGKNKAVYDFSIAGRHPNVHWCG